MIRHQVVVEQKRVGADFVDLIYGRVPSDHVRIAVLITHLYRLCDPEKSGAVV